MMAALSRMAAGQAVMEVISGGDDWQATGAGWTLNAAEAGTAALVLFPVQAINDSTGLSCRLNWRQEFSGSSANFTRLHWLLEPDEWTHSDSLATLPVTGSAAMPSDADLTFLHIGESGSNDSIRWWAQSFDGLWDSAVVQPRYGGFAHGLFLELEWQQPPGVDTARLTVRTVYDDHSTSSAASMAVLPHHVPVGIGFSATFTSSNTAGASFEILQFEPHQIDTVSPVVTAATFESGTACTVKFSEPLRAHIGTVQPMNSIPSTPWALSEPTRNEIQFLEASTWDPGTSRTLQLNGFLDAAGNALADTVIEVHRPINQARPRSLVISEFVAQAPCMEDWVELVNLDSAAVDIRSMHWWDGSTNDTGTLLPGMDWNGILLRNERVLLVNRWEPWMGTELRRIAYPSIPLALHHAGESFGIISAEGTPVDRVEYQSSWWPSGTQIKHAQRRQLQGCALKENWACGTAVSNLSFGEASPLEWPVDSFFSAVPLASEAWAIGEGRTRFNQPLDDQYPPRVKNGWTWMDASTQALHWRIDTLRENTTWHLDILGVKGCFSRHPEVMAIALEAAHFPENGDIIITEIAHDPQGISEAYGTFVELYNPSPDRSVQLDGLAINGVPIDRLGILPPKARICHNMALPSESGNVRLSNHLGLAIDEVDYSRCWHRDRRKASAGFSLVRLQPVLGRMPANASYAWDSSGDILRGCSYGVQDSTEAKTWPKMDALAIACGQFEGDTVVAYVHYSPRLSEPTISLHGMDLVFSPSHLCPSGSDVVHPNQLVINEFRGGSYAHSEPFLELKNPFETWTSTEGMHWTSASLPFPDDWLPVHESIQWFLPPNGTLAFAECPNRLPGHPLLHTSNMPSLWGPREVLLGSPHALLDSVHIHNDRHAPWHADHHSLERISPHPEPEWKSSLNVEGHTAGRRNSWATGAEMGFTSQTISVVNDTWSVSASGEVIPVAFDLKAPKEGQWLGQWRIMNALGQTVAASSMPVGLQGSSAVRCYWDGTSANAISAPGPHLLLVTYSHISNPEQQQAIAVVHVSPG